MQVIAWGSSRDNPYYVKRLIFHFALNKDLRCHLQEYVLNAF